MLCGVKKQKTRQKNKSRYSWRYQTGYDFLRRRVPRLCEKRNTGTQNAKHEARLDEETLGAALRGDGGAGRGGGLDDGGLGDDGVRAGGLVGGGVGVAGRVGGAGRVVDGVRRRDVCAGGGVRLLGRGAVAGAVGVGRVALRDSDGLGHGRRRGGGGVLSGSGEGQADSQDGEDACELHFEYVVVFEGYLF